MAKFGLIFVAVFCIVQISLANRLPRETETTTSNFLDAAKDNFEKLQKGLQSTFTKENSEKLWQTISDGARDINTQLKGIATDVQTKFSDLTKDEKKN